MRRLTKTLIATLVLAIALSTGFATASARNISVSERRFEENFIPLIFSGGFSTVECEIILLGELHARTFPKVLHTLIGWVNHVTVERCSRGSATALSETMPWHLTYEGFIGNLPIIQNLIVLLIGASFRIREPTFGVECLARSTTERPIRVTATRNTATGAVTRLAPSGTIPCGSFSGSVSATSGTWTDLPGLNALIITLI